MQMRRLGKEDGAMPGSRPPKPRGPDERRREALMAAWTRKNGKNDAVNPYSKQNRRGQ